MKDKEIIELLDSIDNLLEAEEYDTIKVMLGEVKQNIIASKDKSSEYVDKLVDDLK